MPPSLLLEKPMEIEIYLDISQAKEEDNSIIEKRLRNWHS